MSVDSETYVIIPVFNEAEVVGGVIKEVRKKFTHVVCVDDGSKDTSAQEVEKAGGILISHPLNLGQGASLQTGIEFALLDANAKYIVTFDADGQHRLQDVMSMLALIKKEKLDIVLGSRFLGKAENISFSKRLVLKAAIRFTNKTSGLKLTDAHNGLRVFNRRVASELNITMSDFAHASEIIERVAEKHYEYREFPVVIRYTDYSRSKGQSMMNAINIGFDLLLRRLSNK